MQFRKLIPAATVLAALAVPAAAPAATSGTGSSAVTADIANTLEATFPAAYAWGNLAPGANESSAQSTVVKSNANWGLKVSSDITSGKMTEWNPTLNSYIAVTPKVFTNAMQWKLSSLGGVSQSSSYASISGTPASVTTGRAATSDSGTAIDVLYKQDVSYQDANAGINDYRIVVNYDAAQGY